MNGRIREAFTIHESEGLRTVELVGRDAWALNKLLDAGSTGCTPIDQPAPRWSHYVWKIRAQNINVETITEEHGGPYSGHHARYVLRARVTRSAALQQITPTHAPYLPGLGHDNGGAA